MNAGRVAFALLVAGLTLEACAQNATDVVQWSAKPESTQAVRAGQKIAASLDARIDTGWHVYSITQAPGGPTKSEISVPANQPFKLAGVVIGPQPESAYDPNFEMKTEFYEKTAGFKVPLAVVASAKPGETTGTIDVLFQTCTDRICLPATTAHVPLTVMIASGGSKRPTAKP
jgi:DsbC/DsbD-like thiol-disulfide interchange protein